jgi:hypothetical protein
MRALIISAVLSTLPLSGVLAADVNTGSLTVKLGKTFLKRTMAAAMKRNVDGQTWEQGTGQAKVKGSLKCKTTDCGPQSLTKSGSEVKAEYTIKIQVENLPDLTATFSVSFGMSCDPARRKVSGGASVSGFQLHLPKYLQLPFVAGVVESILTRQVVNTVGLDMQGELAPASLSVPVCPRTIASSGGDLTLDFTRGTQCTDGQARDLPCGGRRTGAIHQICENGWWWAAGANCIKPVQRGSGDQP